MTNFFDEIDGAGDEPMNAEVPGEDIGADDLDRIPNENLGDDSDFEDEGDQPRTDDTDEETDNDEQDESAEVSDADEQDDSDEETEDIFSEQDAEEMPAVDGLATEIQADDATDEIEDFDSDGDSDGDDEGTDDNFQQGVSDDDSDSIESDLPEETDDLRMLAETDETDLDSTEDASDESGFGDLLNFSDELSGITGEFDAMQLLDDIGEELFLDEDGGLIGQEDDDDFDVLADFEDFDV